MTDPRPDPAPSPGDPPVDPQWLQAWLDRLCRMLPGLAQAVLLTAPSDRPAQALRWPPAEPLHDDVIAAAQLAASQQKCVTTTLSASPGSDAAADTIIARPLPAGGETAATLAVLVNVKPSQQAAVMQLLQWGEGWLDLLQNAARAAEASSASRVAALLPRSRTLLALLAAALLAGVLAAVPGTYRVSAAASLEGKTQRAIVAPFDGYIAAATARAGETVRAGEVIARLDTRELQLEQQRHAAERNEYDRQYRQALVERDQTRAQIFQSQVEQADVQLDLVQKRLERAQLTAPLDGVIISGDLSRSLGAPVTTGEVLFEVAPLAEYRLVILVDEKQVAAVHAGLRGQLTLKALPGEPLQFVVHKVSPVFEEQADGIAYRVEAHLEAHNDTLRPGMQGVARIDIGERSILWIYGHELFDAARLWAWRWLP